ncbi:uncharacterized protein LOC119294505 [Triticum dicoccoides]|uniref:uncharacterized protein LOC119294505 n=1 Tax=Triticum dicoccoides TaxID=85692 RepID=UPI00188EFA2A|nr:uncharacterized protein LOC119294505 [Triticum dicoccoides]
MGGFFSVLFGRRPAAWRQVGVVDAKDIDPDAPTQIRVLVKLGQFSKPVPVQVTEDSTVESVVYLAFLQDEQKIYEFIPVYEGKRLCLEESLADQGIIPNSIILAMFMISGGAGKAYLKLDYMSFFSRMAELPSIGKWLEKKESAWALSKLGRQTFQKLFEMVSLYHARNKCFDGTFCERDIIYVASADSYMIIRHRHLGNEARVKVVDFHSDGYKKDIEALGRVLQKVCSMKLGSWEREIAYVAHLLKIMKAMPWGAESSATFKAFLRNHPCMMSGASRQGLILEVHRHIKSQHDPSMEPVLRSGYSWCTIAQSDADFDAVYYYGWRSLARGTAYYDNERSWFTFCRNFLSHPNPNKTIQDADFAIWWYFGDHLADFLCRLSCTHEFTVNIFDKDCFCTHPTVEEESQTCTFHYDEDPNLQLQLKKEEELKLQRLLEKEKHQKQDNTQSRRNKSK